MVSVMAQLERGRPEILQAKQSSFGRWLKTARQRKGWSGEMLAAAVETSQSMISAYERGFRSPRREKAVELAEALGADPREALEALMADTPGLEPLPELDRIPEETLLEHIELYTGDNPVLVSAREFQKALAAARAAGPVGGEEMPAVVRNGRGARKRIQDVDK